MNTILDIIENQEFTENEYKKALKLIQEKLKKIANDKACNDINRIIEYICDLDSTLEKYKDLKKYSILNWIDDYRIDLDLENNHKILDFTQNLNCVKVKHKLSNNVNNMYAIYKLKFKNLKDGKHYKFKYKQVFSILELSKENIVELFSSDINISVKVDKTKFESMNHFAKYMGWKESEKELFNMCILNFVFNSYFDAHYDSDSELSFEKMDWNDDSLNFD